MDLKTLTMELCALSGPAGREDSVFSYVERLLRPAAHEIKTDALGNLTAIRRCGKPGAKTLLLDAHIDEIGFVVTSAEEGFLRFASVGGVDPRVLPAGEVRILADPPLFGVVDAMPPHVLRPEDMDKTVPIDKLCIDAGLTQEEAERLCPPGTPVVFGGGCTELCGGLLCGKALDDRACAAVMIRAFETLCGESLNVDLVLLLSTQEEVGGRGAVVAAFRTAPDYAVVADATFGKQPDTPDIRVECGKGAAVGIGPNMNHGLTRMLLRIAEERKIPFQTEVCPGSSGTNAEDIQISREGVATALISLPIRYMHTPVETVRLEDMESVLALTAAFARELE